MKVSTKVTIVLVVVLFTAAFATYAAIPQATPETNPEPEIETWYNGQIFIKEGPAKNGFRTYFQYIINPKPYPSSALDLYVSSESEENWVLISVERGSLFKMGEETYKLHAVTHDYVQVSRVLEES